MVWKRTSEELENKTWVFQCPSVQQCWVPTTGRNCAKCCVLRDDGTAREEIEWEPLLAESQALALTSSMPVMVVAASDSLVGSTICSLRPVTLFIKLKITQQIGRESSLCNPTTVSAMPLFFCLACSISVWLFPGLRTVHFSSVRSRSQSMLSTPELHSELWTSSCCSRSLSYYEENSLEVKVSISFLVFQIKAPKSALFSLWILRWTPASMTWKE